MVGVGDHFHGCGKTFVLKTGDLYAGLRSQKEKVLSGAAVMGRLGLLFCLGLRTGMITEGQSLAET